MGDLAKTSKNYLIYFVYKNIFSVLLKLSFIKAVLLKLLLKLFLKFLLKLLLNLLLKLLLKLL